MATESENIHPPYLADTLDAEGLQAVGDIIVRWSRLEWQLGNLLVVILGIPKDAGRVLTIGMEIGAIIGCLKTVTHNNHWIKSQTLRIEIRQLAKDVRSETEKRHAYAHAVFGIDLAGTNGYARYLFKEPPHRILPESEPLDLVEMRAIAQGAQAFIHRATDLTVRLKASREKSASPLRRRQPHRKKLRST